MKNKNTVVAIIILGILILISKCIYRSNKNALKENGIIGIAIITGDKFIKGSNIKYTLNTEEYLETTELGASEIRTLLNKKIPIIYLKDEPKVNDLLLYKKDLNFIIYHIQTV